MDEINDKFDVLDALHKIIDKKFRRIRRDKKVDPFVLESTMTLHTLSREFSSIPPQKLAKWLKELVDRGSVVTNLDDEEIYPFDAYFIPKSEVMDKEAVRIYYEVKSKMHDS